MNAEMIGSDPRDDFSHSMRKMVILKTTKKNLRSQKNAIFFFKPKFAIESLLETESLLLSPLSNGTILSLARLNWQNEYDVSVDCVDLFMNYLHNSNALLILLASSMFRNRLNRIGWKKFIQWLSCDAANRNRMVFVLDCRYCRLRLCAFACACAGALASTPIQQRNARRRRWRFIRCCTTHSRMVWAYKPQAELLLYYTAARQTEARTRAHTHTLASLFEARLASRCSPSDGEYIRSFPYIFLLLLGRCFVFVMLARDVHRRIHCVLSARVSVRIAIISQLHPQFALTRMSSGRSRTRKK